MHMLSFDMLRSNSCTNVKLKAAEFNWHLLLSLPVPSNAQNTQKTADSLTATRQFAVHCRFFAGYRVRPDGIHFVMHADGRPSGMAFVEFDCPQEAMRALVRP